MLEPTLEPDQASRQPAAARETGDQEKRLVALSSVFAAVFLTVMKIVVGVLTGSLGILSEAAHSGLDLVAAVVTLFAVRASARPADREHTYGHGKVENLSALLETMLLLFTCAWIIYEAIQRLFFKVVVVEASLWAFVVMGISIGVDISRSRALQRVAARYNSRALEADALHFSTDVWSSAVVIVGLVLVRLSDELGLPWLAQADAVAALGVAGIVMYVSLQLGIRTVADLLDAVPPGLRDQVQQVALVPGVTSVSRVRARQSGPEAFIDVTLSVARSENLEQAHAISERAEAAIREVLPGADVTVHVEPVAAADEALLTTVEVVAARQGLGVHSLRLSQTNGKPNLELHLEVSQELSVDQAHAQASLFEDRLRQAVPKLGRIVTHIEPKMDEQARTRASRADRERVFAAIERLESEAGVVCRAHAVRLDVVEGELVLSFHCLTRPDMPLTEAHHLTVQVENYLRGQLPDLGRVVIHVEPENLIK
jgi:cation diffusion facilitator family transporter